MNFSGRPRRPLRPLVALAVAGSLVLAGCGGGDEGGSDAQQGEGNDEGNQVVEAPPVSPLTGMELEGKGPQHPVLAVKIDNSANSAPQIGLGSADMVVEELVEGGITRLAAFFYTDVPGNVGPVRSMRATDIGVVQPLDAVLVASGGAPQTVNRVRKADIRTFTEGAQGYYREGSRPAPYNLFMRLDEVAKQTKPGKRPDPYLPFGEDADFPKGKPATGLTASFSPSSSTTFAFRDGGYVNTDTFAAQDDQFVADTVLVLSAKVGDAGYLDPSGSTVPETKFTGRGPAAVFHRGRVVRGTWVKKGLGAPVSLRAGGEELTIPAGKVWIELIPVDDGNLSVTR